MVEREKHLGQTEGTLEFSEKPLLLGTVDLLVEVGGRDRDGVGVGAAVVGAAVVGAAVVGAAVVVPPLPPQALGASMK